MPPVACFFVLPRLREAVAYFARRNTRSMETEVITSSDDGNAHVGIVISANSGVKCVPLLGEPGGYFLQ